MLKSAIVIAFVLFCDFVTAESTTIEFYRRVDTIALSNPKPLDDFGYSVAATNNFLLVGAINIENEMGWDVGAAYIYEQSPGGKWNQTAELVPVDGKHNDVFGKSVAIENQNAMVGATKYEHVPSGAGAVYFFQQSTHSQWTQASSFSAPSNSENFGNYIAMDGQHAVASANWHVNLGPGPRGDRGFISVFQQDKNGAWQLSESIDLGTLPLSFVHDVDISDDTIVVGASQRASRGQQGSYFVEILEDSLGKYRPTSSIFAPSSAADSLFGAAVATDGHRIIVGDPTESDHGAAYIYERNEFGDWQQMARLVAQNIDRTMYFGSDVELKGNLAYITSASLEDATQTVHVFGFNEYYEWSEIDVLTSLNIATEKSLAALGRQVFIGTGLNAPGEVQVYLQIPEPLSLSGIGCCMLSMIFWRLEKST